MRIDILSAVPNLLQGPFSESIVGRARGKRNSEMKIIMGVLPSLMLFVFPLLLNTIALPHRWASTVLISVSRFTDDNKELSLVWVLSVP